MGPWTTPRSGAASAPSSTRSTAWRRATSGEGLSDEERDRLGEVEVALDQCWDLLRQRRDRRNAGLDPDEAAVRAEGTVEGYRQ